MLKQRIVTALVLMAFLVPALFARSVWPFAVFTLVMIGAAGWEWGRLNGAAAVAALLMGAALALACVAALWSGMVLNVPPQLWWLAAATWVIGGTFALRGGPSAWPRVPQMLRWGIGLIALWLAWLALTQARAWGINFVLSVMALVWAADIAAYAGGRAFGRHKLAPTASPGKTWEGAVSGALAVLLVGWAWSAVDATGAVDSASIYSRLALALGTLGAGIALIALSALSVVGDLIESLVKRAAGVKDSSALLPGHGGVLDRVDALLPVFPLALGLASL